MAEQLRVQDIPLPPGVTTSQDPDETVVVVAVPRGVAGLPEEEEAAEAAAAEEGAAPEGSPEGGESGGEAAD
jgi:hypothetical protein